MRLILILFLCLTGCQDWSVKPAAKYLVMPQAGIPFLAVDISTKDGYLHGYKMDGTEFFLYGASATQY